MTGINGWINIGRTSEGTLLHVGTGEVRKPFPRPILGPQRSVLESTAQLRVKIHFHFVLFFLGLARVVAPPDIGPQGVGPLGVGGEVREVREGVQAEGGGVTGVQGRGGGQDSGQGVGGLQDGRGGGGGSSRFDPQSFLG